MLLIKKSTPQLFINNLKCWFFLLSMFCGDAKRKSEKRRKLNRSGKWFAATFVYTRHWNSKWKASRMMIKQSQSAIFNNVIVLWLVMASNPSERSRVAAYMLDTKYFALPVLPSNTRISRLLNHFHPFN